MSLTYTDEDLKRAYSILSSMASKARWARIAPEVRSRMMSEAGKKGGRPAIILTCDLCGASGNTTSMRRHNCRRKKETTK